MVSCGRYRKAEIGSLTKRSIQLDDDPPIITVAAAYSKRKRHDTQVLHPEVAHRLRTWLESKKDLSDKDLLFSISAKVPGGIERRTSKMMLIDLKAARKKWLEEAKSLKEKDDRENSDFLKYQNSAGVSPRTAQSLARHSDIRLTIGILIHVELHDQTAAIGSLSSPPSSGAPVFKTNKELLTA